MNIDVLPSLEAVVFKALEKKPENRFQTMQEMYFALKEIKSAIARWHSTGTTSLSADDEKVFRENSGGHFLVKEASQQWHKGNNQKWLAVTNYRKAPGMPGKM